MGYFLIKLFCNAALIAVISELAKRSTLVAAVLASVPLVSVLSMVWIFIETHDPVRVIRFSRDVLTFILPSLILFMVLPIFLERGWGFYPSLALAIGMTVVGYFLTLVIMKQAGFHA